MDEHNLSISAQGKGRIGEVVNASDIGLSADADSTREFFELSRQVYDESWEVVGHVYDPHELPWQGAGCPKPEHYIIRCKGKFVVVVCP
jgi:hypothetical protein